MAHERSLYCPVCSSIYKSFVGFSRVDLPTLLVTNEIYFQKMISKDASVSSILVLSLVALSFHYGTDDLGGYLNITLIRASFQMKLKLLIDIFNTHVSF